MTPLPGRDLQQLVFLLPGVSNVAGPPGSNFGFNSQYGSFPDPSHAQGSDVSVNGGQGGANAWYLDGYLNVSGLVENVAVNPAPDAVTEFQAVTEGIAAQYGRTGGGVFNVVLKSGINQLHGDLYDFFQNSGTSARNPFTSIGESGALNNRVLHYNDFGGTWAAQLSCHGSITGKTRHFSLHPWTTPSFISAANKFLRSPPKPCEPETSAKIPLRPAMAFTIRIAR